MNTLPVAIALGGISGVAIAVADAALLGTSVTLDTVLKFGVPIAGMVWWVGKNFQRNEDNVKILHNNQRRISESIERLTAIVSEIETHCKRCSDIKPKTDFVDKRVVDIQTPVL